MNQKSISLLLRIGLAFSFLYPPISAFFNPDAWIWFVPDFVEIVIPKIVFLHIFGVFEILVALGILFMKNPFYPTAIAVFLLLGIIIFDSSAFDVVFRDIAILLSGIALLLLHGRPEKIRTEKNFHNEQNEP